MGCSFCTFYTDPEVQERLEELRRLGITQYIINYMHAKFSYYDVNHTGLLDWSEILAILYEDDGPFMRRLLRKFMAKGSLHTGRMTFMGFLLGMWNILTLNLIYLPQFVFELYDENNEGFINGETVKVMVSETYHHSLSKKEQPLPITGDLMEIIKFTSFCHEHSFIVKPVFDIITRLKSKLIGTPFWELETRKRLEIFENRYLTLDQALHELRILIEYTRVRSDGTEENSSSKKASNSPATGRRESKSHDHGEPPHHHNAQVPASSPQHPKPNLHTAHSPSTEHLSPSPHIISSSGAADSENHHKHHHHPKHIGHAAHEPSHLTPQETAKLQEEFFGESDEHLRAQLDSHFYETPSSHDTLHRRPTKSQMDLENYHPHTKLDHHTTSHGIDHDRHLAKLDHHTTSPVLEHEHHHFNHHLHANKTANDLGSNADSPHKHKPHHTPEGAQSAHRVHST